jgi:hypothetical protein
VHVVPRSSASSSAWWMHRALSAVGSVCDKAHWSNGRDRAATDRHPTGAARSMFDPNRRHQATRSCGSSSPRTAQGAQTLSRRVRELRRGSRRLAGWTLDTRRVRPQAIARGEDRAGDGNAGHRLPGQSPLAKLVPISAQAGYAIPGLGVVQGPYGVFERRPRCAVYPRTRSLTVGVGGGDRSDRHVRLRAADSRGLEADERIRASGRASPAGRSEPAEQPAGTKLWAYPAGATPVREPGRRRWRRRFAGADVVCPPPPSRCSASPPPPRHHPRHQRRTGHAERLPEARRRRRGAGRFVYASSVAAYGFHADNPPLLTGEDWPGPAGGLNTFQFYAREKADKIS